MGDIIDLEEYRRRLAKQRAQVRQGKVRRSDGRRRREREIPLTEPAERREDEADERPAE